MTSGPDPYVPSGREFDEGLTAAPASRMRRIAAKLRLVRDDAPRRAKIRDFELELSAEIATHGTSSLLRDEPAETDPRPIEPTAPTLSMAEPDNFLTQVALRPPTHVGRQRDAELGEAADDWPDRRRSSRVDVRSGRHRRAATWPPPWAETRAAEKAEAQPAPSPVPRQTSKASARAPIAAATIVPPARQVRSAPAAPAMEPVASLLAATSPELVVAWMIVAAESNSNGRLKPAAAALLAGIALTEADTSAAFTWWRIASGPTSAAAASGALRDAICLPASIDAALASVASFRSAPLESFRRQAKTSKTLDAALRDLKRKQRDYPSIAPVTLAIEARDLTLVEGRLRSLGYDSAGWHGARAEITTAMTALTNHGSAVVCARGALPSEWTEGDRGLSLAGILSPILRERDCKRLTDELRDRMRAGLETRPATERAAIHRWLTAAGSAA